MEYLVLYKDNEGRFLRDAYTPAYGANQLAMAQARFDLCVRLGYEMHSHPPSEQTAHH